MPDFGVIVDKSSSKTPSRVNASTSDRNGSQVHHKHSETYRQWSQYLTPQEIP